jgi:hypothetical protein
LICITAVDTRIAASKYVTGNVKAWKRVYDRRDATPFVAKAV